MRIGWVIEGFRTGIVTTRYPARPDPSAASLRVRPALFVERCQAAAGCDACVQVCLPNALALERPESTSSVSAARLSFTLDVGRCIGCGLCAESCPADALMMISDGELAARTPAALLQTELLDARGSTPGGRGQE
jgi:NADH dehydrogenase (ubiquinone) Fe-S protein 8